jgi:phosphatidate cytidylyltransferase
MTRIISGAILIACATGAVWLAPPLVFLAIAELLLVVAVSEYAGLARAGGIAVPATASTVAAVLTSIGLTSVPWSGAGLRPSPTLDIVLMTAFVALAAVTMGLWRGERDALARAAAAVFPSLYLALPIGAMVAVRQSRGPAVLFLLVLTVVVSDTAQYYTGRLFGRRPLAPAISPKKTIEGAIGGFIAGSLLLVVAGRWWLPVVDVPLRALLGVAVVALGIAGDLFESMLKRSAGVKDSSTLIPGHGGILDRIDALLFAAPVYYIVLKYV